jgi:hypothetical protein
VDGAPATAEFSGMSAPAVRQRRAARPGMGRPAAKSRTGGSVSSLRLENRVEPSDGTGCADRP